MQIDKTIPNIIPTEAVASAPPHPLRVAVVEFEADLKFHELPAFRAAIAEKAGLQHYLFHNHLPDGGFRQQYPLIQYKVWRSRPMLFCLQEGIDAVQHFFVRPDWTLFIGDREMKLRLGDMSIRQMKLQVWDTPMNYQMRNWIPFNTDNYNRYKTIGLKDRIALLESTLTGNILTMAGGIGWQIQKKVEISILDLSSVKWVPYKGIQHMAFDVQFSSNVFLPKHLGLGRKVAVGFGCVRPEHKSDLHSTSEE